MIVSEESSVAQITATAHRTLHRDIRRDGHQRRSGRTNIVPGREQLACKKESQDGGRIRPATCRQNGDGWAQDIHLMLSTANGRLPKPIRPDPALRALLPHLT